MVFQIIKKVIIYISNKIIVINTNVNKIITTPLIKFSHILLKL